MITSSGKSMPSAFTKKFPLSKDHGDLGKKETTDILKNHKLCVKQGECGGNVNFLGATFDCKVKSTKTKKEEVLEEVGGAVGIAKI